MKWAIAEGHRTDNPAGDAIAAASPSGRMLSDSTMSKLMRELGLDGTPHGMRAAFRSWCSDTGQPRELAEQALGHLITGVGAAYADLTCWTEDDR